MGGFVTSGGPGSAPSVLSPITPEPWRVVNNGAIGGIPLQYVPSVELVQVLELTQPAHGLGAVGELVPVCPLVPVVGLPGGAIRWRRSNNEEPRELQYNAEVVDADTLRFFGRFVQKTGHGYNLGEAYWEVQGQYTSVRPIAPGGALESPAFRVWSADVLEVTVQRPSLIAEAVLLYNSAPLVWDTSSPWTMAIDPTEHNIGPGDDFVLRMIDPATGQDITLGMGLQYTAGAATWTALVSPPTNVVVRGRNTVSPYLGTAAATAAAHGQGPYPYVEFRDTAGNIDPTAGTVDPTTGDITPTVPGTTIRAHDLSAYGVDIDAQPLAQQWQGSAGAWTYTVTAAVHGKGLTPFAWAEGGVVDIFHLAGGAVEYRAITTLAPTGIHPRIAE